MSLRDTPFTPDSETGGRNPELPKTPVIKVGDDREAEIDVLGVKIRVPLPKWAVAPLAAAVVLGLITFGVYLSYAYILNNVFVPRSKLNEYAENLKHSLEPNEQKENQLVTFKDGTQVTVNHFKSDGCNQIVRYIPALSKADGLWMFGPALTPDKQSRIGRNISTGQTALGGSVLLGIAPKLPTIPSRKPEMIGAKLTYAQFNERSESDPENYKEVQLGGRCWDPHPGPWNERPQQTAQCAVQVWRYFGDGCIHFQWFNPCSGTWDVYPNGAPRVYWQRCVH